LNLPISPDGGITSVVEREITLRVRQHHPEELLAIVERRRIETGVRDAAALSVTLRVEHSDVVAVVTGLEERAHTRVREAEDGFEITTGRHLSARDDLVAVLRAVEVRPQQTEQRVARVLGHVVARMAPGAAQPSSYTVRGS
jgi:hypothetical protein